MTTAPDPEAVEALAKTIAALCYEDWDLLHATDRAQWLVDTAMFLASPAMRTLLADKYDAGEAAGYNEARTAVLITANLADALANNDASRRYVTTSALRLVLGPARAKEADRG